MGLTLSYQRERRSLPPIAAGVANPQQQSDLAGQEGERLARKDAPGHFGHFLPDFRPTLAEGALRADRRLCRRRRLIGVPPVGGNLENAELSFESEGRSQEPARLSAPDEILVHGFVESPEPDQNRDTPRDATGKGGAHTRRAPLQTTRHVSQAGTHIVRRRVPTVRTRLHPCTAQAVGQHVHPKPNRTGRCGVRGSCEPQHGRRR